MQKTDCIVLNKSFIGSYVDDEKKNAHEIINFLRADDGNIYVYCNPYGQNVSDAQNLNIKYFLVTSEYHKKTFFIEYVFKIKGALHTESVKRGDLDAIIAKKKNVEKQIVANIKKYSDVEIKTIDDIKYGGKSLTQNFFTDEANTFPMTYLAEWIKKPKTPIRIKLKSYNYQRNFGYVTTTKNNSDYSNILKEIELDSNWEKITLEKYSENTPKSWDVTFMDLINMHKEEECYTNILFNLFMSANDEPNCNFVQKFMKKIILDYYPDIDFRNLNFSKLSVDKESVINSKNKKEAGRLDLLIKGENFQVIIENKIESSINYIYDNNTKKNINQLSRYYEYFYSEDIRKEFNFFLLFVPVRKKMFIHEELLTLDENNISEKYKIIDYKLIYEILTENKDLFDKNSNFRFKKYWNDIITLLEYQTFDNKKICEINLQKSRRIKERS